MVKRICPMCFSMPLLRADVRTCSAECSLEWRQLSNIEKQERLDRAARKEVTSIDDITEWLKGGKESSVDKVSTILGEEEEDG